MWIVLARQARPLASVWVGRRWLAVVDAIVWPAAWIALVLQAPLDAGLAGRASIAVALLMATRSLWTAVAHNERYRFFTARAWSVLWVLLAAGAALQFAFWLARVSQ